jgi:PAS domain S-box-containing protein
MNGNYKFAGSSHTILGYEIEYFSGRNVMDFVHPDDLPEVQAKFVDFITNKESSATAVYRNRCADGSYLWFETIGTLISDNEGNPKEILFNTRNITERKQAEEALHKSEVMKNTMVSNIGDVIVIIDKNGTNQYKSPNVAKLFGWKPEELIGKSIWDMIYPDDLEAGHKFINAIAAERNATGTIEVRYKRKEGDYVWIEITATNLFHNKDIQGILGNYHDISERKRAEQELQESEEMLRNSQSLAHISSYSTDLNINELWKSTWKCSPEFYKIFGIDETYPHTLEGWAGFIHPDFRAEMSAYHQYVVNKGIPFNKQYKIIRINDGAERWVQGTGKLVFDEMGTPVRMHGAIQDITEHKQAEEALQKSEDLLNASQRLSLVGGWAWDVETHTMYWTEEAYRIHGFRPGEIDPGSKEHIRKSIACYEPEDRPVVQAAFQRCLKEGQPYDLELPFTTVKGGRLWVRTTARPIRDRGKVIRVIGNIMDITERKQAEKKIIAAKEKAEESDHLKSAFLANMSHEIRTPMNGILGFAGLLKKPDLKSENQQKYIGIIEKSGMRMLNIINDIVDISKIEAGLMELDMKKTNVNEQIEYTYAFFKPEADTKGITLSFTNSLPAKEATIKTDGEKLYAILSNLIKNAIKYTEKGSIELGYQLKMDTKPGELEFYVKDAGIGIPKDRQEAIFERFIQADIADTKVFEGSGLGLAITKSYVEMLGGAIWVESQEGKGSTFYFTLPYYVESVMHPNERQLSPSEKNKAIRKLKILIAEDDKVSEMLLDETVKMYGKEILKARTGAETVEVCHANPDIDLILMDIQMPDMDGYEATQRIREFNKEVIILAQTAYGLTGDREKSIESGCNDYLAKPIGENELRAMIEKYFGK